MLALRGITKRFGRQLAVDGVSLEVRRGELLTLLGPSGCGKSTTLRIIAGLIDPDEGELLVDGEPVLHRPAHRRDAIMVFQSHALFPHMTVAQNVGFGLRMRRLGGAAAAERVAEAIRLVELVGLEGRFPRQLSGGQQQRVALARALAVRPKVLLLDEPLSSLDAQLRDRLRVELRTLQQRLGVTTVYVTHDQSEALSLSDRIAVMVRGRLVEVGTPQAIYAAPASRLAAEFLGAANLLSGRVVGLLDDGVAIDTALGRVTATRRPDLATGQLVTVCLRPETIRLARATLAAPLQGRIAHAAYLGAATDYLVALERGDLTLRVQVGDAAWQKGDRVALTLPPRAAVFAERPAAA